MEKKFYILTYQAEQDGYAIVELDILEAKLLREVLSSPLVYGGGYCGSCHLSINSYYSKDSAMDAILEGDFE